jgi:NADH-quinone oxidoreductase subunit B
MEAQDEQILKDCAPFVKFAKFDELLDLSRANSLWPLTFGLACCAIEMMAAGAARFDLARFGAEVFRPSPRQADVMIVAGTINKKMASAVKTLYDQMPEPKWVIAMGNCAISGGPFVFPGQYAVVEGVDEPIRLELPTIPVKGGAVTLKANVVGAFFEASSLPTALNKTVTLTSTVLAKPTLWQVTAEGMSASWRKGGVSLAGASPLDAEMITFEECKLVH